MMVTILFMMVVVYVNFNVRRNVLIVNMVNVNNVRKIFILMH